MGVIWGKREGEYFWEGGWTGEIRLIEFRKLAFWRNGPWVEPGRRHNAADIAALIQSTLAKAARLVSEARAGYERS
jgi:hypothetical protein